MRDDKLYLLNILECINQIQEYATDNRDYFMSDRKTQDAVIRNFEIIGEATKQVSQGLRDVHPEIPWRRMAGFRDVLIHNYLGVDISEVWQIVQNELKSLKSNITLILNNYPS
jgi:uncharacterized protein with HEPN domain